MWMKRLEDGQLMRREQWYATHVVVLSRLWKTKLFLHMAIATALLPNARQYVLINKRFDCGKNQMAITNNILTK